MKVTVPAGCAATAAGALSTALTALLFALIVAMGAGLLGALLHATRPAAITANIAPFLIRIVPSRFLDMIYRMNRICALHIQFILQIMSILPENLSLDYPAKPYFSVSM